MKTAIYKIAFLGMIFAMLCAPVFAQSATQHYNDGNKAYREKNFEQALQNYIAAVDAGGVSAELYYNLGAAYFRTESLGNAILWFERARFLDPTDAEIKRSLAFARSLTQDRIESLYGNSFLFYLVSFIESIPFRRAWQILLLLSILATISTIYTIFQLKAKSVTILLWTIFALCLAGWWWKGDRLWERELAIVMESKLDVHSEPSFDSALLFTIHEGTRVAVAEARGGWAKIVIEDGQSGWAPRSSITWVIEGKNL